MKIAFDGSSLLWTCLLVGEDREGSKIEHNGRLFTVNTAEYGYEFAVNSVISNLRNAGLAPKDIIFVWEGMNSKAPRLALNQRYKTGRGDRPAEAYAQFSKLKAMLQDVFGKLGALSITQDNCEGDDTLGWLAENTEEDLIIRSGDNDISVLNGTNKYGAEITVLIKDAVGENKYGNWPCKYITVYKALVGDSRDTISGIKGFGPTAFESFMSEFGIAGLAEMDRLAQLGSLEELVPEMDASKTIAKLVMGASEFLNSYALAKIHPEWVNTFDNPIQWKPGIIHGTVNDERLKEWEATSDLVTNATWEQFKSTANRIIEAHNSWIALDIETSTPDESDEWIAAQGKREGSVTVDVIGSELTGMSLTFGSNMQHTVYIPVDHKDTDNVPKAELRDFIATLAKSGVQFVIQNTSFEGTVLFNEWGADWKDNGFEGYLPNMLDTKFEASYVNENKPLGLKALSKMYFDYSQVDYATVTTIDGVQYKMRELTGSHVKDYGCDDAMAAASLHNFFKLVMQLEHTWQVYLDVEIDAMYLHTQSFVHGFKFDMAKSKELEAIDAKVKADAWTTLSAFLIKNGWEGSIPPAYTDTLTPAQAKEAFELLYGKPLESRARLVTKLAAAAEAQGGKLLAELLRANDFAGITELVRGSFVANPEFNPDSSPQLRKLLYGVMGFPVRVFNKPTDNMKKAGIRQGSPKTDALAIAYAKRFDATPEQGEVLDALQLSTMVTTREGLYYSKYPYFVHWKTGRIHSSHNQCQANTRRASASGPNTQALPKAQKIEGHAARFREAILPHKLNAVVVSMDFVSQEILLLAEWSHDPVLEEVFTGTPPKDMHSMTAVGIYNSQNAVHMSYEEFKAAVEDQHGDLYKTCKKYRALGKAINFSGQYRVSAKKMATMLFVTEAEAQAMIDAKAEAFPVSEQWALDEMSAVRETGVVKSLLGAIRHLTEQVKSIDSYESSKADRQALSYRIQGSAAEMTKQAEGEMWKQRLEQRFDCQIIGPIHDEVVASCAISDLYEFLPAMHKCMTRLYANMRLPIRSSISFGPDLYRQIEIGNEATKEAISFGLQEFQQLTNGVSA